MSHWIKHFIDGTREIGRDADVMSGKASWSRGRLDGIASATISYAGTVTTVSGSEIWQKDTYGAAMGLPPKRISRSLGVRIQKEDIGKNLFLRDMGNDVYQIKFTDHAVIGYPTVVKEDHVGWWAVVTIKNNGNPVFTLEEKYRV